MAEQNIDKKESTLSEEVIRAESAVAPSAVPEKAYLQCWPVVTRKVNRLRSPEGSQPIELVKCMSVARGIISLQSS